MCSRGLYPAQNVIVLGAMQTVDLYRKDFDIDTMKQGETSYLKKNVFITFTSPAGVTWDGTYPETSQAGAFVLHFSGQYQLQIYYNYGTNVTAFRVNFGGWKPWHILA